MSTKIKSVVNSFAFDKVVALLESGNIVTPQVLDAWEFPSLWKSCKNTDQKIGRNSIREIRVQYILSEFDGAAFGVESKAYQKHEISEKTIRSMKNQRKKKFADLKIVKAVK
ncbi:gp55.2 conserved hypothetical protein [Escherichia phage RB69]|uniref:Uncharacterized protein 55.2 n=1 Tax=Escherichia phage RB69 TaxID=12353 RepID=Q7Y569_BPR69|nr:gp55.2 conserved hypothetical protein [Escherichia phage RB69]AAP75976.1 gp55.2 conserved hypothetical protein [Escherichia phage RB69]